MSKGMLKSKVLEAGKQRAEIGPRQQEESTTKTRGRGKERAVGSGGDSFLFVEWVVRGCRGWEGKVNGKV